MTRRTDLFAVGLFLVAAGCGRSEPPQTPVARIDDQTLTLETVRAQFDSARGVSDAELQEYIRRWINNEILYREAVRRGLDRKEHVLARLEDVRRQLAINALLEEDVYQNRTVGPTPPELEVYYRQHLGEFSLSTDVALVSFVLFSDRDASNTFRTAVLQGTAWNAALGEMLADPQSARFVTGRVDSMFHTQSTLLPQELWRVAAASRNEGPSFPIQTNDGFYILAVWKYSRQGQTAELKYVEDEIHSRLTMERRRQLLDSLMENLRSKHSVQILINAGGETPGKE